MKTEKRKTDWLLINAENNVLGMQVFEEDK